VKKLALLLQGSSSALVVLIANQFNSLYQNRGFFFLFFFLSKPIDRSINARDDKDALVFTGCGVTGAINHLIRSMRLWPPRDMPAEERPIVFIGPHEHHSNILPWRESICEVVSIPEDPATGILDETVLEEQLIKYKSRPMRIGSFSAASNVTGILIDTIKVTRLLKSHGALAFWDFASAGPYIEIDMNPLVLGEGQTDYHLAYKDAIFLSPHKLVGGVSSPGVLCAKKVLFNRELPPGNSGGGTIDFVTDKDHVYLNKIQEREEGGTPDIVGCIRAGLAFQLKNAVTTEVIEKKEHDFATRALARMTANPRIHVLGPLDAKRLAVISFVIFHQSGKLLHYNFVCALLNDLFGIQCRGGCVCAGPYGQQLLGIDKVTSKKYEEQITGYDDVEAIRPGFVRISFNFFTDEREFNFVLDAIDFVATHGWKFLPEYGFLPETNEWQHTRNARKLPGRKWLGEISYATGKMEYPRRVRDKASLDDLSLYMPLAKKALQESEKEYEANKAVNALDESKELLRGEAEFLRWFVYPAEAYVRNVDIDNDTNNIRHKAWRLKMMRLNPFVPKFYGASGDQAKNDVVISHNKEDLAPTSCGTNGGVCAPGVCAPRPTVSSQPTEEADRERWSVKDMVVERSAAKAATEKTPAQPAVVTPSHSHVAAEPSTAGKPNGEYERGKPWKKLRNKPQKHSSPEEVDHHIFSTMRRALKDFDMIKPHDKVLIGVSGGKDSLTLLHMFMKLRKHIPLELAAVTLDPQTLEFDPSPLKV
jgi:selenocysteine lyase/cysteine desulfurase